MLQAEEPFLVWIKRRNTFNAGIVFHARTGGLARLAAHEAEEYKWLRRAGCGVPLALYPASDRGQQQMLQDGGQETEQV